MPDQEDVEDLGGTLRLGAYPCILKEGTRSRELFGKEEISADRTMRTRFSEDW